MQHSDLYHRFAQDLQIEGHIVQVGTLQQIFGNLTAENLESEITKLDEKDGYFLGGVQRDTAGRAKDSDVISKNYFFVDFDIRKFWKQEHGEELSDSDIKDRGLEILYSFSSHPILVFEGELIYDRDSKFGTATLSLPINICCIPELDNLELVEMPGVEPGSNVYGSCPYDRVPFVSHIP